LIGTIVGGTDEIQEYRSTVYGEKLIPFLRSYRQVGNSGMECYPIAASNHYLGYLVMTGFTPNSIGWSDKIGVGVQRMIRRIIDKESIE
jgi:hypothetical protein